MKIIGIITEYNPFHNGHQYQIQEIRKKENADYVIVAMSGDFVQRGAPAITDKYTRTKMALSSGADLVVMLPTAVSLSSAETFARGGVSILSSLGVDCLTYGCETPDKHQLQSYAGFFQNEDPEFSILLKNKLREGLSYPLARQEAFVLYLKQSSLSLNSKHPMFDGLEPDPLLLSSPNNILGIEYEKAIQYFNIKMKTIPIQRIGKGYHDTDSTDDFSSATAIRNHIMKKEILPVKGLPKEAEAIFKNALFETGPVYDDLFSQFLGYRLWQSSYSTLLQYQDCSSELANRILHAKENYRSFSQFVMLVKTKGYTQTRIQRLLMQLILSITSQSNEWLKSCNYAPYARILGFRSHCDPLIKELNKRSSIPILTSLSQAKNKLENLPFQLLEQDLSASELYQLVQRQEYSHPVKNDFKQPFIIV